MNVALLREVQQHVRQVPQRVGMGNWLGIGPDAMDAAHQRSGNSFAATAEEAISDCYTTGCIAGWIVLLGRRGRDETLEDVFQGSFPMKAAGYLDIYTALCDDLFFVRNWDDDLQERYYNAVQSGDQPRKGEVIAEAIERFIQRYANPII
jgi:hypothetical protein